MPEPTAGRPDPWPVAHSVPGGWSHSAVRLHRRRQPSWARSPGGTRAAGQARRPRRRKTDPAPVQAPSLTGPRPPLRSATPPGVLRCSRRFPRPALRARADANRAHPYSSADRRCSRTATAETSEDPHMQLAALRGASDGDGRPGGRRPRPYALRRVEMQLLIHPLLGLGRRSAMPAMRVAAHRSHCSGAAIVPAVRSRAQPVASMVTWLAPSPGRWCSRLGIAIFNGRRSRSGAGGSPSLGSTHGCGR
jgi:hypothetical protein